MEKVLAYDRSIVAQETGFWCGPAATQIVLDGRGVRRTEGELARRMGAEAHLIDSAADIDPAWLADKSVIGVTAGASAPETLVRRVIDRLQELGASPPEEMAGRVETITFSMPRELRP